MDNMKITLSKFAGFCDGVRRAYEMVSTLNITRAKKPIYILGSLAHNADVVREIEKKGISKISLDAFIKSKKGDIGTLIITAHGVGPEIFALAKQKEIEIIDTTCPKVIKVQRLAKVFSKRDCEIILVGDRGHKEVEGINSWGEKKAKIISCEEGLKRLELSKDREVVVITQTTQDIDFFEKVRKNIQNRNLEAKFFSTICLATHDRQEEIKRLAGNNDVVVIIGSQESANSTRLFEIAKARNAKTYFIENAKELKLDWFKGAEKVLLSAGASTPSWIIEAVVEKLNKF
jgi:4-hydroxy-3-methylbut-2-enyl diphosphate reductase